jgi:hypothetical protein
MCLILDLHIGFPRAGGTKAVKTWRTSSEFGGDLDVGSRLWNGQLAGGQDGWARWRRWSWQASPVLRWQLRRTQSGCPSKRRDRCLTVPIRSMPVGGSAFRGDHRPGRSQGTLSPAVCVGWRRDRATRRLLPHHPGRSRLAGKVGLRRSLAMVIRHCGLWRCGGQPATDILDRSHLKAMGRH